ncbi:acetolactate synthase AlsS [Streptomyces sp. NBC_01571]|uniref:acetolactate synthase AlsS n=1 Tax=Streptomyces sp. NBC_01571 TaxID=2975883 RepID=UPI00225AC6E3|nr:acetolactate synthase AlsS [Streptomyces sp. NBC_01571]MCX4572123.1 acetolactate synthase AlsS [Streptomyces sp. NBC_01571]
MPTPPIGAAQRMVETLSQYGVPYVFGVPGSASDAVHDALAVAGPELVMCHHEQNAAVMAAAVGLLTGTPGAVLATPGAGTANLMTGLLLATSEQHPVIAVCAAGTGRDRFRRTQRSMDAIAALRLVTTYTCEVRDPDHVPEAIANALRAAVTPPRGAAAVVIPEDVAGAPTAASVVQPHRHPSHGPAPAECIHRAAQIIRAARQPVLLVGARGADTEACTALRELIRVTGLPVVETFQAAGIVPRALEEQYAGRVGLFRDQPGDAMVTHADALITVGYDPVEYDPGLWNTDPARTIVHIDTLPAEIGSHYQPALELRGDVAATVDELSGELSGLPISDRTRAALAEQHTALARIEEEARTAPATAAGLDPGAVIRKISEVVDDDATVVSDTGSHLYLARHFRGHQPRRILLSNGPQTPGVGLPRAMTAALLRPGTQVVSVSGDGGFLAGAPEMETATRLGLHATHVIMRDNAFDTVAFQEHRKYGRASGVRSGACDITLYACAFGARGIRTETMDDFETELRGSLDPVGLCEPGITVIDVPVDYTHNAELFAQLQDGVPR